MNAGRSARMALLMPSNTLGSTPSALSEALTRYGPSVPISTALRTRSVPYFPIYRVTSPVPIEKPTSATPVNEHHGRTCAVIFVVEVDRRGILFPDGNHAHRCAPRIWTTLCDGSWRLRRRATAGRRYEWRQQRGCERLKAAAACQG